MTGPEQDEFDFDTPLGRFITGVMSLFYGGANLGPEEVRARVNALIVEALPQAPTTGEREARAVAQDLVDEAWEEGDERRGCEAALGALRLDPDCADAYVYLGQSAGNDVEVALPLFTLGVMAGYASLGQQRFDEDAGHFWGIPETRPFMRALEGVAHMNWLAGAEEAAAVHFRELLRLNPNDNQGARYPLGTLLLEQHDAAGFDVVDVAYEGDGSAAMAYLRALAAFQREGDSPRARERLSTARAANPHLGQFLAGLAQPSIEPQWAFEAGSEAEAVEFAAMMDRAWEGTPEAMAWLRRSFAAPQPKAKREGPRSID
ncbi:MAG: hypothetical protein IT304_04285 [Dehalococcoidia bacterium]|nr:hypothetical protein [Dehalococcoidia bacterium]